MTDKSPCKAYALALPAGQMQGVATQPLIVASIHLLYELRGAGKTAGLNHGIFTEVTMKKDVIRHGSFNQFAVPTTSPIKPCNKSDADRISY